ncbi:MAG: hypothetical protein J5715_02110 [Clostridiales bacterium]|nr:hypothetical protein [Clostridiales bacterium]
MADTIKCPQCSANLIFNPDTQKLECAFCGGAFDPSSIESTPDELKEGKTKGAEDQAKAFEGDKDSVFEAEADNAEFTVTEKEAAAEDNSDKTEFVCNACGARVVTDSHTSATFCAFCGSPALVGQRLADNFKPKYLIPFSIGREKAENLFIKWAKGGRWTPMNFVSQKNIEKLTGLYVPFWLFDYKIDLDVTGKGSTSSISGNVKTIKDYEIYCKGKMLFDNVPFDGETRIDDALMEAIEPYDMKKMIPYDYKYLPGFFADRYDLDAQGLKDRAVKRGHEYIDQFIKSKTKKYDSFSIKENKSAFTDIRADYALLPVWFMSYKYLGKYYYFAINGQTGEVAGTLPISPVKKVVFFFILLAILAVIVRAVMALIMGGTFG